MTHYWTFFKLMAKPYYPNNWELIAAAPPEVFKTCTFDEFFDWKVAGWELPSSVHCVIRCENTKTGKVKEWSYSRMKDAHKRIRKLCEDEANIITIVDDDEILNIYAEDLD